MIHSTCVAGGLLNGTKDDFMINPQDADEREQQGEGENIKLVWVSKMTIFLVRLQEIHE